MIEDIVASGLIEAVANGRTNPFTTYREFARTNGLSDAYCPSWANRPTLNKVADTLKSDPTIGIDLTFLIRSSGTGYPSVIDATGYDRSPEHQKRARDVADQIIAKWRLGVKNPY
jgi:hypothetical protein